MVIAATDPTNGFGYRLLFLLHILAIVVAFAPGFVQPVMAARLRRKGKSGELGGAMSSQFAESSKLVHGPALVLAGLFGIGLVGMSDKLWKFSQTWVSIALVLWFIMIGVFFGLLIPAERKAGRNESGAEERISMFMGMLHILLLLMLIDMIWKPGIPV